jgi:transcriptional regulator with XRE-family HTH domain
MRSLAERAQISTHTLKRAERGDLGVAVGTMLQLAALVGVPLYDDDPRLAAEARAGRALLRRRVRPAAEPEPDLDF